MTWNIDIIIKFMKRYSFRYFRRHNVTIFLIAHALLLASLTPAHADLAQALQRGNIVDPEGSSLWLKQHKGCFDSGVVCKATVAAGPRLAVAAYRGTNTPTFTDPVVLVTWLIQHSGRGFDFTDEAANSAVFSPGLRKALHASFVRSRQRNEPPCGADGDIILETQEGGAAENIKISKRITSPIRVTVTNSFDVDGYHRNQQFMTVNLDGIWKLENIIDTEGGSLRRTLECRR